MESYEKIMGLVEEVRDILNLHEIKGMKKAHKASVMDKIGASHPGVAHPTTGKVRKATKAEKGAHAKSVMKAIKKGHAGSTVHNPFKNINPGKHLGGTSSAVAKYKGPSTTTPGMKRKRWRCRCNNYHCLCTGKNPETGKQVIKHVKIGRQYKKTYNMNYKKWRKKHAKIYAAGGNRGFRAPAKAHHKRYKAD